jgi:hypothetical protein
MINELERKWKETLVASFKIGYYPDICKKGLRKNTKLPARIIILIIIISLQPDI